VRTAASSPNGESIAVGSSDGILRVWDVGTGNVIAKWTGYMDHVGSVCWGADGEHVASGCEDGMVRVWDAESDARSRSRLDPGLLHVNVVVYSPNTTTIATGGGNDESGVLRQASCSSSSTQSKAKFRRKFTQFSAWHGPRIKKSLSPERTMARLRYSTPPHGIRESSSRMSNLHAAVRLSFVSSMLSS
jgi:WD40 repeat protein